MSRSSARKRKANCQTFIIVLPCILSLNVITSVVFDMAAPIAGDDDGIDGKVCEVACMAFNCVTCQLR